MKEDFMPISAKDALTTFRKTNGWRPDTISSINMYGKELALFAEYWRNEGFKYAAPPAGQIREWCKCDPARYDSDDICMYCDMPRKGSK